MQGCPGTRNIPYQQHSQVHQIHLTQARCLMIHHEHHHKRAYPQATPFQVIAAHFKKVHI